MIDQTKSDVDGADYLLSSPVTSTQHEADSERIERRLCSYENKSQRFLLKEKNFTRQYAQLYAVRLMEMRKSVAVAARRKWGSVITIKKTVDLKPGMKCCVIGTLFKKMDMKPAILKELSVEHNIVAQPPRQKYIDESDELLLEDESQRMRLTGNIPTETLITGLTVAVLGFENNNGKFEVDDYCFSGLPYQASPKLDEPLLKGEDRYLVLVSGLGFGETSQDCLRLQMFVDLITGQLGSVKEQDTYANVARVIVAGNSLSQCTRNKENEAKAKYLTRNIVAGSVDATKNLDDMLAQLAACAPVDIMPGEYDPTNYIWPQQPLHPCMFPLASRHDTLQTVTNPYDVTIGGVRIVGTSGRNINDIYRFSGHKNRLDIMKLTLQTSHIAPTAPDTLGSYPYYDSDPFILKECPQLYFVGNQPEFASDTMKGSTDQEVTLVLVPDFATTGCCVLVNLRTLQCEPVMFSSALDHNVKHDVEKMDISK